MPLISPILGMKKQQMSNPLDYGQLIDPSQPFGQQTPPILMPDNAYAPGGGPFGEALPHNAQPQNWYGYGNSPATPISGPQPPSYAQALAGLVNQQLTARGVALSPADLLNRLLDQETLASHLAVMTPAEVEHLAAVGRATVPGWPA